VTPILVPTDVAAAFITNGPITPDSTRKARQRITNLARDGRITNRGKSTRNGALWDLWELAEYAPHPTLAQYH